MFEIEDAGLGVPEERTEEIFTFGFSTKEGSNRGVGLALTRKVLSEIGGSIFLEEGELSGACFVVTIPKDKKVEGE